MRQGDQELVHLYREDGSEEAITTLITRYTRPLYSFILQLVGDRVEAESLTQEAFLKMWKGLERFDLARSFKTWLFAIARNVAIDSLRKKRPLLFSRLSQEDNENQFEDSIRDEMPLADENLTTQMQVAVLSEVLETLSLDERTIIMLHEADEFTFEEIASILERPMNTVKSRYRRALVKLKEAIALHQKRS